MQRVSIVAPVEGKTVLLSKVPDPVFSQKMMGDGVAFDPTSNCLRAPLDGMVTSIFPTQHAFQMIADDGLGALIHIGIDTVDLGGKGFALTIKEGQHIQAGEKIGTVDFNFIRDSGLSPITIVVFPDEENLSIDVQPANASNM